MSKHHVSDPLSLLYILDHALQIKWWYRRKENLKKIICHCCRFHHSDPYLSVVDPWLSTLSRTKERGIGLKKSSPRDHLLGRSLPPQPGDELVVVFYYLQKDSQKLTVPMVISGVTFYQSPYWQHLGPLVIVYPLYLPHYPTCCHLKPK